MSAIEELLGREPRRKGRRGWVVAVLAAVAAIIAGGLVFGHVRNHRCSRCGGWGQVSTVVLRPATEASDGREEVRFSCPKCGWTHAEQRALSRIQPRDDSTDRSWYTSDSGSSSSDSSGGDSGGDSGGSSDGGGGGDW